MLGAEAPQEPDVLRDEEQPQEPGMVRGVGVSQEPGIEWDAEFPQEQFCPAVLQDAGLPQELDIAALRRQSQRRWLYRSNIRTPFRLVWLLVVYEK